MSIKELKGKKCRWIYFKRGDQEAIDFLSKNYKFHALDLEDVVSPDRQRPKVDIYKYYLFFVAVFPHFNKKNFRIEPREVDVFVTEDTLITVAKNPNSFLEHIFDRVEKSAKLRKMWLEKGSGFLFYKLLEKMYRESHSAVDAVSNMISHIEEDVYDKDLKNVARDISYAQRCVLMLHRIMEPQRFTVGSLVDLKRDYLGVDMSNYFDDVHDFIEKTWAEIDMQKYTISSLRWTNETMISHHTNRIITILTVISASLMPLTLLTGIYGMNLSHLPWANEPTLVFSMFGFVALFTLFLVLIIFKLKK